jgi:hypothetical protein
MIHPLIRRLHTLQMHGSPDSMRPLGGSGGEHRADKVDGSKNLAKFEHF